MGLKLPEAMAKSNQEIYDRLSLQHISFLIYYGSRYEGNTLETCCIRDVVRAWVDLIGCDNFNFDTCYNWRNFYHQAVLGHKKGIGIGWNKQRKAAKTLAE